MSLEWFAVWIYLIMRHIRIIKTVHNYPGKVDANNKCSSLQALTGPLTILREETVKFTCLDVIEVPHRLIKVQVCIA